MKNIICPALLILFLSSLPCHVLAKDCDRQCLINLVDNYVAAMVAHNTKQAPLSRNIRMVENVKKIKPGEGLWKTAAAGPEDFVIHVPDPVSQQVGYLAVMQENIEGKAAPVEVGLRLKLENGQITEAEHMVIRNLGETALAHLKTPRKPLVSPVAVPYRDSRSRLLYIGASYYDALDENNGSLAPFADDCVRFENGNQSTRNPVTREPSPGFGRIGSLGCEAQLDTNIFAYITHIDNRRIWIADEINGMVFGLSHFRHAFETKEYRTFGIPGQETSVLDYDPFDMPAIHIYKIWGGMIHEIEAIGIVTDYMSPTGWE